MKLQKLILTLTYFLGVQEVIAVTPEQIAHENSLTAFAKERCATEQIEGKNYSKKATGDGKIEVSFFGKKGGDLSGKFVYTKEEWKEQNRVLREHQSNENINRRECIRLELKSLRKSYSPPNRSSSSVKELTDNSDRLAKLFSMKNYESRPVARSWPAPQNCTVWATETLTPGIVTVNKSLTSLHYSFHSKRPDARYACGGGPVDYVGEDSYNGSVEAKLKLDNGQVHLTITKISEHNKSSSAGDIIANHLKSISGTAFER